MRLIDADKLETHKQLKPFENGNYEYIEIVYKDDIDDAPTIGPERKTGEWGEWIESRTGNEYWICSECGFSSEAFGANILYRFCPNCGADMRGEQ